MKKLVFSTMLSVVIFIAGCTGTSQTPLEKCNAISDEHEREHCILDLAIETNNASLCNQLSDPEEVEECLEGTQ